MKRIKKEKSEANIDLISDLLSSDKVGAIPCDTIYGISARVGSVNEERIYEIKRRPQNKSLITLMSMEDLRASSLDVPEILFSIFPAPLTAILRGRDGLTHAVRVPADPFMLRLLEKSGPIYSTSVNISGERSLLSFEDVLSVFDGTLDFIVKGEGGKGSASTIVDMSQKPYRVVRMGAFDPRNLI